MNNLEVSVIKILESMDVSITNSTFESRLDMQKSIYLAQAAGLDLGFSYNWYIRGPYCPRLTELLFGISTDSLTSNLKLSEKATEKILELNKLIKQAKPNDLEDRLSWKELLASVHYLMFENKYDSEKIKDTIKSKKPWYTLSQIDVAITATEKFLKPANIYN